MNEDAGVLLKVTAERALRAQHAAETDTEREREEVLLLGRAGSSGCRISEVRIVSTDSEVDEMKESCPSF